MDYAFWEEEQDEGMGPSSEPVTQPFELTQVEKHKNVCLECGSSDIFDDEGGVPVCAHCGAVYSGQVEEMVEYNEMHRGMTRTRQIRRNVPSVGKETSKNDAECLLALEADCLKGLQATIKSMAERLSKEVLMGDTAVVRITRKLWMGVLVEWAKGGDYPLIACFQSTTPPNKRRSYPTNPENGDEVQSVQDTTAGHENNNGSASETATAAPVLGLELVPPVSEPQATHRERKRKKRSHPKGGGGGQMVGREILRPSMPLALAIVYCSCRWLQNGIVPIDLVRLCRDGTLPYIRAFESLPDGLREILSPFRPFFSQSNPPSTSQISFLAGRVAMLLGLNSLPPLNVEACGLRFATALRMPLDVILTMKAMVACAEAYNPPPTLDTDKIVDIKKEPTTTTSQGKQSHIKRTSKKTKKCIIYGYDGLSQRLGYFLERASPTHVMALLVLSVRCGSLNWPSWTYNTQFHPRDRNSPPSLWSPLSAAATGGDVEYSTILRKELKCTLETLQGTQELLNPAKGKFVNTPSLPAGPPYISAMKSSGGQEIVEALDRMADNLEGNLEVWSTRVRPAQVTSGLNLKYRSKNTVSKKASTWGAGLVVYDNFPNRLGRPIRPGPTRVVPDELHPHLCLLVEVCAAHLEPIVLAELVIELDKAVAGCFSK